MADRQMLRSSDYMHERAFSILLCRMLTPSVYIYAGSKVDKRVDNLNIMVEYRYLGRRS